MYCYQLEFLLDICTASLLSLYGSRPCLRIISATIKSVSFRIFSKPTLIDPSSGDICKVPYKGFCCLDESMGVPSAAHPLFFKDSINAILNLRAAQLLTVLWFSMFLCAIADHQRGSVLVSHRFWALGQSGFMGVCRENAVWVYTFAFRYLALIPTAFGMRIWNREGYGRMFELTIWYGLFMIAIGDKGGSEWTGLDKA